MCRIKYFINRRDPEALCLADQMRDADIDFSCIPTSGPSTLWVDGRTSCGSTEVRFTVGRLLEVTNEIETAAV